MKDMSLTHLLLKYDVNPLVKRCLKKLDSELVKVSIGDNPLKTRHLQRIYTIRVKMDNDREIRIIEGGEDLLKAFEKETNDYLRLSAVEDDTESFIIFSDCDFMRLIGIIAVHLTKK